MKRSAQPASSSSLSKQASGVPAISTSDPNAPIDNDDDTPHIKKRPRRTHARRSCQMCQQRKARCELPDLEVPSSPFPLPDHQSCHRCRTLQISCIVDDANKKKPKKPAGETGATASDSSARRASASTDRRALRKSSTNASMPSSLADTLSRGSNASSASLVLSGAGEQADANDLKYAGGRVLGDQIVYPAEARLVSKTPESSSDEDEESPSPTPSGQPQQSKRRTPSASSEAHIKTQERNPRDVANVDVWERFNTRSRPITLLTELVPRQNGFASKVFRLVSARATIETDVTEIISNAKSKQLADWCENNLAIWIPHLRNAYQIRQESFQGKQTLSTQLLEQVLYLIAMQHIRDPRDDVMRFSITRFIIRDLARLMLTTPRSPEAVQALELLALFPVDVSAIPGPCRNRIRTDSLINSAERYARSVRLDRVALTAAAPYSFVISTNQPDDFDTKRTAMSWASVKTWYNTFTLGDDELYESIDVRFFSDDWSRSLVLPSGEAPSDRSQPRASVPETELFEQRRWSNKRRVGSVGLAMRCLVMRQLLVAFEAIRNTRIDLSESERLASLSSILDNYKQHVDGVDEEFRQRLVDSNGEGGEVLRLWLTIEATAGHLLVLGTGILRGLGIDKKEDVPSHELALLIRGENASPGMREFLTRYGEHRILAAETVLVNVSTLCRDARRGSMATASDKGRKTASNASQGGWMVEGQSRAVLPLINVCGYALEAAFNAMEMHATMFKLWKTPPKRSESWQLVFSNVVTAMLSLDPNGSIRNGSIPATCAYILQGMLKVIVAWTDCSRKKDHQRCASSSSAAAVGAALNGGIGRQEEGSRNAWQNGSQSQWLQQGRSPAGAPPADVERYSALLQDDLAARKSYDGAHGVGGGGTTTSSFRDSAAFGPGASSYSMTASMFESDAAAFPQYSNVRGCQASQGFAPDATEALAAALPHSASWASDATYAPSHPHQHQSSYFGPYRAPHPPTAHSSNASSHTHTPPAMNGANGMLSTASNGSPFSIVQPNGDTQSSAFDSLDFILNDVLASSEWSGILQDIWRTEM